MNEFFLGSIVGSVQVLVGYPLDTIKTNLQTNKLGNMKYSIPRLYKGFKYPLFGNAIINSFAFGTTNYINSYANNYWVSGFFAGTLSSIIINPIELYKVREQVLVNSPAHPFKGIVSTIARESIAMSIYFGSYHSFKKEYKYNPLLAGGLSGWLSWLFTYPIDVVKSRVQSDKCTTMMEGFKQGKLWKGFGLCSLRGVLVNSVGFWIYDYLQ